MQKPTKAPDHDKMLCPNCGSNNVVLDENAEVISTDKHAQLEQYNCADCHAHFIPAMTESVDRTINKWAKKMRTTEGLNEERSWAKPVVHYIIIKQKDKK